MLDTGTTLILGPSTDVDAFWHAVGHEGATRKNIQTSMWEVRCDRGVAVGFILGGGGSEREYSVDPADISWAEGGSVDGWCMGGIQANDEVNSGDWLLGDIFLKNVSPQHDERVVIYGAVSPGPGPRSINSFGTVETFRGGTYIFASYKHHMCIVFCIWFCGWGYSHHCGTNKKQSVGVLMG